MPSPEFREPDARELAAIDELLQVMYWLRGEQLAEAVTASELVRWVGTDPAEIEVLFERLMASGLVYKLECGERYALSASGVREGGRRFADEFADWTKPGHGECGDPNCDCHQTGDPADCHHRT